MTGKTIYLSSLVLATIIAALFIHPLIHPTDSQRPTIEESFYSVRVREIGNKELWINLAGLLVFGVMWSKLNRAPVIPWLMMVIAILGLRGSPEDLIIHAMYMLILLGACAIITFALTSSLVPIAAMAMPYMFFISIYKMTKLTSKSVISHRVATGIQATQVWAFALLGAYVITPSALRPLS